MPKTKGTLVEQAEAGPLLRVPDIDTNYSDLRKHYAQVNCMLASFCYDDAILMCLSCGQLGENFLSKVEYGHARFCSQPCLLVYEKFLDLRPKVDVIEATRSEPAHQRGKKKLRRGRTKKDDA